MNLKINININIQNIFKISCFKIAGFKLVLRPNMINSQCAKSRYQPMTFRTTGNSDCVFSRSICTEEGLVVHNIGTNLSDTTCRCDYRNGYTFVIEPKNKCYCLPFEEDCSCYRRNCRPLTQGKYSTSKEFMCWLHVHIWIKGTLYRVLFSSINSIINSNQKLHRVTWQPDQPAEKSTVFNRVALILEYINRLYQITFKLFLFFLISRV